MDTILRDIPMPKIFLANAIREGKTYRVVIDGQQRISAILDFLRDGFTLDDPYQGAEKGKKFSELEQATQNRFLSYSIDFNEAINPTDEEVREVYARVNKYIVALNKQELRRADFPGDFLTLSEELAVHTFFDEIGIFSPANRRRYADVEYVSELLAAQIDGIQDKKSSLDGFYTRFSKWDRSHMNMVRSNFNRTLDEIASIFSDDLEISKSRFSQKADFYTLFLCICDFHSQGYSVVGKELGPLRDDLKTLEENIRPESEIDICSEYAIKCVSQANSASSRRWRQSFLQPILGGTFVGGQPDPSGAKVFYRLMDQLSVGDSMGLCPEPTFECPACGQEISSDLSGCLLAWRRADTVCQISNAVWIHRACTSDARDWLILERPHDDQPTLF